MNLPHEMSQFTFVGLFPKTHNPQLILRKCHEKANAKQIQNERHSTKYPTSSLQKH